MVLVQMWHQLCLKWRAANSETSISMGFNIIMHHETMWAWAPSNLILDLFWQRNPHQSEGMAHASQLLFPHGSDLCCVCRGHQSNQIPHHLSSSKCIPFSFIQLAKPHWKLITSVCSGVGRDCSVWGPDVHNLVPCLLPCWRHDTWQFTMTESTVCVGLLFVFVLFVCQYSLLKLC